VTTLAEVRDGIEVRLKTIPGLRVYSYIPGTAEYPAAMVRLPAIASYRGDLDMGYFTAAIDVLLMVPTTLDRMQADLYPYVERTGERSVFAAIEADRTLGHSDVDAHVVGSVPEGIQELGGTPVFVQSVTISVNLGG
jgi:hypothetical protein